MANIFGTQRIPTSEGSRDLLQGLAFGTPVLINPNKEQLKSVLNIERAEEPVYEYDVQQDGKTVKSIKIAIWLKVPYRKEEVGVSQVIADDTEYKYVEYVMWSKVTPDQSPKGAWYVSSSTCKVEWWPNNNRNEVKYPKFTELDNPHMGIGREKDVYKFLDTLFQLNTSVSQYNITTPFTNMLKGDWREINAMLKANLTRTDQTPRGVKVLLGVRAGDEGKQYQAAYGYTVLGQDVVNTNELTRSLAYKDWEVEYPKDYRFGLYSAAPQPGMPANNIVNGNAIGAAGFGSDNGAAGFDTNDALPF